MTPLQTHTIMNVGQQSGQVKAGDRLSLDGVGQHSLSNVYLTIQPVSCLSSPSTGSVCIIAPLCTAEPTNTACTRLNGKHASFFLCTVNKIMWSKIIFFKPAVLAIHLQGITPPRPHQPFSNVLNVGAVSSPGL